VYSVLCFFHIRGSAELLGFRSADGNAKSTVESGSVTTIEEGGEEIDETAVLPIPIKIGKCLKKMGPGRVKA